MIDDGKEYLKLSSYIDFGNEIDTSCLPAHFLDTQSVISQFLESFDCTLPCPLVKRLANTPSHISCLG
jgi:hypothetical protein